ncbi:unnamed protein product [Gadus morhua 'NCC']
MFSCGSMVLFQPKGLCSVQRPSLTITPADGTEACVLSSSLLQERVPQPRLHSNAYTGRAGDVWPRKQSKSGTAIRGEPLLVKALMDALRIALAGALHPGSLNAM